jgi:uncharacterized iron-regulated protein
MRYVVRMTALHGFYRMSALGVLLAACATQRVLLPEGFVQTLGRAHPLAGKIYATAAQRIVSAGELAAALERAEFAIVGESHDNRDHHALEAQLLGMFLDAHPRAAVGFEMLDEDVRAVVRAPPRDPDAFARAVGWQRSGWPEFTQYRPVFEVALAREARLVAAHPSREHVRASMGALPDAETRALGLDRPLPAAGQKQLEDEIRAAHCGHASEAMLGRMVRAQRYKDAFMARSLVEAGGPGMLVTGNGHARNDRGVPYSLRLLGARRIVSVALIEVEDALRAPGDYDLSAFDYAVFTPRTSDADPCRQFEEQLKSLRPAG